MKKLYSSTFIPSSVAYDVLQKGKIIDIDETPSQMIERMVSTLFSVEEKFGTSKKQIEKLAQDFGQYCDRKACVMSTPVMTNAGRYAEKPLSACTVPPVDLRGDLRKVKKLINEFHADGMGTGFNLDDAEDPISMLKFLNDLAVEGAKSGKEDRPVGNMAILSVHHPQIIDFIKAKVNADQRGEEWKFNISVNASDAFMVAAQKGKKYQLHDGTHLPAKKILKMIVKAAHNCADPGLAFIDRLNKDNPTPGVGNYVSTAPCAEVGLAPGESCQFGYINLAKFLRKTKTGIEVDLIDLEKMTRIMTRALDNALEVSLEKYAHETNTQVMKDKRKIGIGICGLADMLVVMGIPYASTKARNLAKNISLFINYISKVESHELAKKRGSCGAMELTSGNTYKENPGFIEKKYAHTNSKYVSKKNWKTLADTIRESNLLRNASTIAFPPTGRSGLVIDASTGVEPLFTLLDYSGTKIHDTLIKDLKKNALHKNEIKNKILASGRIYAIKSIPTGIREIYKTAVEINPLDHLLMVKEVQQAVDESISKTINMSESSSPEDILSIYTAAYNMGLKGITIYRTGSRKIQPRKLAANATL